MPGGKGKIQEYNESITPEELKANRRKGGKNSGVSRREKASMSRLAQMIGDSPVSVKNRDKLKMLGLPEECANNNAMVVVGIYKSAILGKMDAVEKWQQLTEVKGASDGVYDLPARVLGRAYVDLHRAITANKKYVCRGGRGSLKSSTISLEIIQLIKNNPTMHACIVRSVGNTLRDSVYAQIKWAIDALGLNEEFESTVSPLEIRYKETGQRIYFRGCDDPTKLKSIKPQKGYIGILWVEEADQLNGPEELRSVEQSVLRGGDKSYEFISYNPPKSKSSWVNKEILVPDENRIVHESTYMDAPPEWLGQRFIEDAEHLKEVNPAAYEHEYLGVPNGDGGSVFTFLEIRTITDEEAAAFDRIHQGVDWGWYPDQYAFLRTHYDAGREKIYLIDENYVNKQSNTETAKWIKDKGYDDFNIICDSAEPKSVNDYRDHGIPARGALKGPGSVEYGFKWLQSRTIVIDPARTPNALKELTEYEYARDKNGDVVSGYPDGNDHLISALRYAYEPLFNKRGYNA